MSRVIHKHSANKNERGSSLLDYVHRNNTVSVKKLQSVHVSPSRFKVKNHCSSECILKVANHIYSSRLSLCEFCC